MFRLAALYPGAPFLPIAQSHFGLHQLNDLRFRQTELHLDCFEGRPVLPRHFNDAIYGRIRQVVF